MRPRWNDSKARKLYRESSCDRYFHLTNNCSRSMRMESASWRPFRAMVNRKVAPLVRRASERRFGAAAQNDLLISTASQWRIGQLHEGSPDTTPAREEPRGLNQGEGCNPHGIVRGSGERCCSLSHSRKLWWNDEGRRAVVFCLRRPLLLSLDEKLIFLLIKRKFWSSTHL